MTLLSLFIADYSKYLTIDAYLALCQTSTIELLCKNNSRLNPLSSARLKKHSIVEVWQGSK